MNKVKIYIYIHISLGIVPKNRWHCQRKIFECLSFAVFSLLLQTFDTRCVDFPHIGQSLTPAGCP